MDGFKRSDSVLCSSGLKMAWSGGLETVKTKSSLNFSRKPRVHVGPHCSLWEKKAFKFVY